ncbi:MAG: metallophosphoesterase [Christensenellales bacterium]
MIFGGAVWFGIIFNLHLGIHHASELTVKRYDAEVAKDGGGRESSRVVLIADLHLGYSVGAKRIEDMVEKVNAQNADIVLIAGDIFDNTVDGIDDPESVKASLRSMKSRLGVYACWGNHDAARSASSAGSAPKSWKTPSAAGRWSGLCATAVSSCWRTKRG